MSWSFVLHNFKIFVFGFIILYKAQSSDMFCERYVSRVEWFMLCPENVNGTQIHRFYDRHIVKLYLNFDNICFNWTLCSVLDFVTMLWTFTSCLFSAKCKITEVQKCEGEAVANNRKGKLIFFYEWDIVLEWTGTLKGGEKEVEGSINIPNLSEENNISEVDVSL